MTQITGTAVAITGAAGIGPALALELPRAAAIWRSLIATGLDRTK